MSTLTLQHNRRAYMAREVDHQTYYAQFVTPEVERMVRNYIGEDKIKASADPHFNDISLGLWDNVGRLLRGDVLRLLDWSNASTTKDETPWHSLSDLVCIVKAAARKIRGW